MIQDFARRHGLPLMIKATYGGGGGGGLKVVRDTEAIRAVEAGYLGFVRTA